MCNPHEIKEKTPEGVGSQPGVFFCCVDGSGVALLIPDIEINAACVNSVGLIRRTAENGIKRDPVGAVRE